MSAARPAPLRVLHVVEDDVVRRAIEHVVREEGDLAADARSVEQALSIAGDGGADVAFVEVSAFGGAALALFHHLPALAREVCVHAIVHPLDLGRAPEALALGARGVLVAPPTGEAVARVLSDVKEERARRHAVAALEASLAHVQRRLDTYDRLLRFSRGAAPSDAVRAIVDGVAQLSSAKGVALYATFGDDANDRVLLAAIGTARDLPPSCPPAELTRLLEARAARIVPLITTPGEIGLLALDEAPGQADADVARVADLAGAMLSLVDRRSAFDEREQLAPPKHFGPIAERLLTLAKRHGRRCSVLVVTVPSDRPGRREEVAREIVELVRETDALGGVEGGDLVLFLPETGGMGANALRRRILSRMLGDRRARPSSEPSRAEGRPRSRAPVPAIGVATFPHDGATRSRLVEAARARAADDARSVVHALGLDALSLPEVVDALLSRPMLDAGSRSSYPLDIARSALFALVARACKEAERGGEAHVTSTLRPGLGVAAAARQVGPARVYDVRAADGCEDVEAIVIQAEHGSWACCGRVSDDRFRGVHAADPLLADVLALRLSAAGGGDAG